MRIIHTCCGVLLRQGLGGLSGHEDSRDEEHGKHDVVLVAFHSNVCIEPRGFRVAEIAFVKRIEEIHDS